MKKILKLFIYYILIILGLFITSWIIWSRFIRQRIIRDVPDELFNEFRFWILLYICIIYIIVIKNVIKPSKVIPGYKEIIETIYKPLTTLDEAMKYNKFTKAYYYKLMFKFTDFINFSTSKISNIKDKQIKIFVFFMQIFPRLILIALLLADTFYFSRIELFYKAILIGILPFIFRYFKYTCKNIYEHWLKHLEEQYEFVKVYEEGYEFDETRVGTNNGILHNEEKTIKEFIQIKLENMFEYLSDRAHYIYTATPYVKDEFCNEYLIKKYNTTKVLFTSTDINQMNAMYHKYIPHILSIKMFLFRLEAVSETPHIKWPKIFIFGGYLLCWSYILYISYKTYPVELHMGKYFLLNLMKYLIQENNAFSELYWGSTNKNMITIESIKYIVNKILTKYIR